MCPPDPDASSNGPIARYTPDSRRSRYALAGLGAVAAPVLFYYTVRLVSSTWSGTLPSLLVLVGAASTLVAAALSPTALLAPDSGGTAAGREGEDTAIGELKRRYASGEVPEAEFERRLEALIESEEKARSSDPDGSRGARGGSAGGERERDGAVETT